LPPCRSRSAAPPAAATAAATSPRGATAFIGAGGGGDTICAAVRALAAAHAHPSAAPHVLGAGYPPGEYRTALSAGSADRASCGGAATDAYLAAVMLPLADCPDVWRVGGALSPEQLAAFAQPLVPPGKDATWQAEARFKYKSLLEESAFAACLSARATAAPAGASAPLALHMFVSTAEGPGSGAFARMQAALRGYIEAHSISHLVVIDCGGDILDARRAGRDVAVLQACCALVQALPDLTLSVEVFGAGADAHADAASSLARLDAVAALFADADAAAADDAERGAFTALLERNEGGLAAELLGEGRATGNFLLARRLLADVARADVAAVQSSYERYAAALHRRVEYARATPDWRAAFDAANAAFGPRAVLQAGAAVYAFRVNSAALARLRAHATPADAAALFL
jgi:hypothetical protein